MSDTITIDGTQNAYIVISGSVSGQVVVNQKYSTIDIAGSLSGTVEAQTIPQGDTYITTLDSTGVVRMNGMHHSGLMQIGTMLPYSLVELDCASHMGVIRVLQDAAGTIRLINNYPVAGEIEINGSLLGVLELNNYLDTGASISVGGSVVGQMDLSSVVWGSGVTVSGDLTGPISAGSLSGVLEIGGDITTGYVQSRDTVGDPEVSNSGANKIRGNSYAVTQAATLTTIEQYFDIVEATPLVFFVYEADEHEGPYTLIHDETVEDPGTGLGYYASNPMNVELQAGKYYIIGTAWLGSGSFTYYWDEAAHPWPVTFGHTVAGYASIYFGNLPYDPDPSSSLLYCQRLTAMNPSGGSISVYRINGGPLNQGQVRINGSLTDSTSGDEIVVGSGGMIDGGAIAVDYDGWDAGDTWQANATVSVNGQPYGGNTPDMHIWEIQHCKGDMNNNGDVDPNDPDILWHVVNDPNYDYGAHFPGLEGSLWWHGDLDCSGGIDAVDVGALAFFAKEPPCCLDDPECAEYEPCRADLDRSGEVGLADLAILLASYGLCEGEPGFEPDADFNNDGCVGLGDLGFLLAVYGQTCGCFAGRGGEGSGGQGARVSVEPYDTNGFTNGGFAGESDHFVFDLVIETTEPGNDWTASGVVARAENDAAFRLASAPTDPDEYASFVSAPRVVDGGPPANNSGATVAGAYLPVGPDYDFDSTIINLSWFDKVDSNDGPAAVMRLVIDVSAVPGADTSAGLGSVYFSQTGPARPAHIKVVDLQSATGTRFDAAATVQHNGEFFVVGE